MDNSNSSIENQLRLQHGNPGFVRKVTNEFIMGGDPDIPYSVMLSSSYNSENGPMCMI